MLIFMGKFMGKEHNNGSGKTIMKILIVSFIRLMLRQAIESAYKM